MFINLSMTIIIFQVLEISEDRKEELKLAKHSQTMVNVIEDFEHGRHGFYNYGESFMPEFTPHGMKREEKLVLFLN